MCVVIDRPPSSGYAGLHSQFVSQALQQKHGGTEYGLSLRRRTNRSETRAVVQDIFHHGQYVKGHDADVLSIAALNIVYSCRLYEREDRNHAEYWEVKTNDMSRALQRSEQHSSWLRDQADSTPVDERTRFALGQSVMAEYAANAKYYSAVVAALPATLAGEDGDEAAAATQVGDNIYTVDWADGDANCRMVSVTNIRAV